MARLAPQEAPMTTPSRSGKLISNIFTAVIYIYLIPAIMIFTPYYNWQYAKENGFVAWLFLGEIVPTLEE